MGRATLRLSLLTLLLGAMCSANPMTLTVSQNAQPGLTFNGNGAVAYGSANNLLPVTINPKQKPLFNVAILGASQPVLPNPYLLDLLTVDYKLTSNCATNCVLSVDLLATGYTQPYSSLQTNLSGFMLNGGPNSRYLLTAWLDPLHGAPIQLGSCMGTSNSAANCVNTTAFTYSGAYNLELKLQLDAKGGSGTFTDSYISGAVPEPATLGVFGLGLVSIVMALRRRGAV